MVRRTSRGTSPSKKSDPGWKAPEWHPRSWRSPAPHSRKWPAAEAVRSRVMNNSLLNGAGIFFAGAGNLLCQAGNFSPCYSDRTFGGPARSDRSSNGRTEDGNRRNCEFRLHEDDLVAAGATSPYQRSSLLKLLRVSGFHVVDVAIYRNVIGNQRVA